MLIFLIPKKFQIAQSNPKIDDITIMITMVLNDKGLCD
jgi:hypothetical protein